MDIDNALVLSWNRLPNTRNGNPRYGFCLHDRATGVSYIGMTKPDANFVYGLPSSPIFLAGVHLREFRGGWQMTDASRAEG